MIGDSERKGKGTTSGKLGDAAGPANGQAAPAPAMGRAKQRRFQLRERSRRGPPDGQQLGAAPVTQRRTSGGKPAGQLVVRRTPNADATIGISPSAPTNRASPGPPPPAATARPGNPRHRAGRSHLIAMLTPSSRAARPAKRRSPWAGIDLGTRPPPAAGRKPAVEMPAPAETVRIRGFQA